MRPPTVLVLCLLSIEGLACADRVTLHVDDRGNMMGNIMLQSKTNMHQSMVSLHVTGRIFSLPEDAHAKPAAALPWHVVVETAKKASSSLRAAIQNNSASTFTRPRVTFLSLSTGDGVETSPHHVPTLRSLFQIAMKDFPEADTYTYVNADIAVDGSFVTTADAVAKAVESGSLRHRFLVVGRRTNVDWKAEKSVTDKTFLDEFAHGKLFQAYAQDYFMVSPASFKWDKLPPFIVGHRGYDNWLVDRASHDAGMDVVDATPTLHAMHMTDGRKGNHEGFRPSPDGVDYNMHLMRRPIDPGCARTSTTQWATKWGEAGDVKLVQRPHFCNQGA